MELTLTVEKAFLALVSLGDDLLLELEKGGVAIEGSLKTRIDAYKHAHSEAKNVVPLVGNDEVIRHYDSPFGGGPISNPPPPFKGQGESERSE